MRSKRETSGLNLEMKVAKQTTPSRPNSATQGTATGSGSRPTGSRFTIESSAPASAQRIRPTNVIGK